MEGADNQEPSADLSRLGALIAPLAWVGLSAGEMLGTIPPITKRDGSAVTMADFAIQAILTHHLLTWSGAAGFICEESAAGMLSAQREDVIDWYVRTVGLHCGTTSQAEAIALLDPPAPAGADWWVIDPIDGTAGFVAGSHFSVCVARVTDGVVRLGAVLSPRLTMHSVEVDQRGGGVTVLAERGKGAWLAVGDSMTRLRRQPFAPPLRWARSMNRRRTVSRLQSVVDGLQMPVESIPIDSQCKYALVSMDRADLTLRLPRQDGPEHGWDHLAGALVAQEAGAVVTDILGRPLDASKGSLLSANVGIVCAPPEVHPRLIEVLAPLAEQRA
jgi:3'-phosphoadenosine 5'-phosphosulfate (PAPS) 3'-phosphatase